MGLVTVNLELVTMVSTVFSNPKDSKSCHTVGMLYFFLGRAGLNYGIFIVFAPYGSIIFLSYFFYCFIPHMFRYSGIL